MLKKLGEGFCDEIDPKEEENRSSNAIKVLSVVQKSLKNLLNREKMYDTIKPEARNSSHYYK